MSIKEEVLNKVFINRNENNQINQDLCAQSIDLTLEKFKKIIDEVLKNRRRVANEQIKGEQSLAHTHTAINHIESELKTKIEGEVSNES